MMAYVEQVHEQRTGTILWTQTYIASSLEGRAIDFGKAAMLTFCQSNAKNVVGIHRVCTARVSALVLPLCTMRFMLTIRNETFSRAAGRLG
jgi:hypothetical protein